MIRLITMHRFVLCLLCSAVITALSCPGPARAADAPTAAEPNAAAAAPAALTSLNVVYIESELRQPGLATPAGPDSDLVDWKVPEVGRLMQERAPLVLAANGLTGTGVTVPAPAPDADPGSVAGPRPVLLLRIATITKSSPRLFAKAGSVAFDAQLLDQESAQTPRWRSRLGRGGLGFDPVLGVLKTNRVDVAWVDGVLLMALDQLAERGLVKLSGPKAVRPKD